ncbi:MAG: hypothetical protein ACFFB0_14650 [Promethearchaeota archaeon]
MKTKYIFIGFIVFNLMPYLNSTYFLNSNLQISNYSLGFKEGEVKTYIISSFNEDLAQEYLGNPFIYTFLGQRAYPGAYRYILINSIEYVENLISSNNSQLCNGWVINISSWDWLTKDDWELRMGDPDDIYNNLIIYENPQDLGENFYNIEEMSDEQKYLYDYLNFPYAIPTPVNVYLSRIEWAPNWSIEGTKISIKYKEVQEKYVEKIHYFNKNGFLKKTLLLTDNGKIIFEYCLEPESKPIIILSLFICIAISASIGLIYLFIKKVKIEIPKYKKDQNVHVNQI